MHDGATSTRYFDGEQLLNDFAFSLCFSHRKKLTYSTVSGTAVGDYVVEYVDCYHLE